MDRIVQDSYAYKLDDEQRAKCIRERQRLQDVVHPLIRELNELLVSGYIRSFGEIPVEIIAQIHGYFEDQIIREWALTEYDPDRSQQRSPRKDLWKSHESVQRAVYEINMGFDDWEVYEALRREIEHALSGVHSFNFAGMPQFCGQVPLQIDEVD